MNLIPSLQPADLLGKKAGANIFPAERNVYFYSLGRTALLNGVQLLAKQKPGRRTLLVPSFICEEALWPLREAGYQISYYSIDDKFKFSLPEIVAKAGDDILAIMAVHYFGISTATAGLKQLCVERGLYLIEDCAHSFIGRGVGQAGAISFFSIRKFLPVPDGGALVVNDPDLLKAAQQLKIEPNQHYHGLFLSIGRSLKNWIRGNLPPKEHFLSGAKTIETLCPRADLVQEKALFRPTEGMSRFSRRIMERQDVAAIDAKRCHNYNELAHDLMAINGVDLPCSELSEGQAPYVLPILVEPTKQLSVLKALILAGIGATDWPQLPPDLPPEQKAKAEGLSHRIVLLPIHQYTNRHDRERIVQAIRQGLA